MLVLSGVEMIPGIDRNPPKKPLANVISPPVIQHNGEIYWIQLFVWKELAGAVEKWTLTFSKRGTPEVQVEQLADHVGDAVGLG